MRQLLASCGCSACPPSSTAPQVNSCASGEFLCAVYIQVILLISCIVCIGKANALQHYISNNIIISITLPYIINQSLMAKFMHLTNGTHYIVYPSK